MTGVMGQAVGAGSAPRVAVVDCPTALGWLRAAGVDCLSLPARDLGSAPLGDVQLLILPLDRVQSDEPLRAATAFAQRGGKVLAVYWGTLARAERQGDYPVYSASTLLGARVTGWTMIGPATLKPEMPAGAAVEPAPELALNRLMLVRVEPEPSAQVLARVAPSGGAIPLVLALRNGNLFYIAANLFHRGSGAESLRRLFFWMMDQATPGLAMTQAREHAGAAMAAVIRAEERLAGAAAAPMEARQLLQQARDAATRARTLAASEQFVESAAAADQATLLTERALKLLEAR
jgi:hypothetical protein